MFKKEKKKRKGETKELKTEKNRKAENNRMIDLYPNTSIITLTLSVLNHQLKDRDCQNRFFLNVPTICYL